MPYPPYSWLLFDADGTLFDYAMAEERALQATFLQLDLDFQLEHLRLYRIFNAQVWKEFENGQISAQRLRTIRFERLFAAAHLPVDPQQFSQAYLPNLALCGDLLPGVDELLPRLARRYHLALITNGLKDVQRPRLEHSAIRGLFEAVHISDEIGAAKPKPRFFDLLFERIGQPPKSELLVIGDSLTSDIQGAALSGLDACWYNPTHLPPDPRFPSRYEIHALPELLPILGL